MPAALRKRLVRRAAKEASDNGSRVTTSDIMCDAIEEYLDLYESATFVPAKAARQRALAKTSSRKSASA
jgi:hypothetical protein